MSDPEVYVLTRNTNMGYLSLDSNSDIVQGVSRVFPVFFLLVAALVCITTMTRMVEEERTQIGTMKALATPQPGDHPEISALLRLGGAAGLHVWHRPWLRGVSNYSLERLFHHSEPDQRRDAGSGLGALHPRGGHLYSGEPGRHLVLLPPDSGGSPRRADPA